MTVLVFYSVLVRWVGTNTSEKLVPTYQMTQCFNPTDHSIPHLQNFNLKSNIFISVTVKSVFKTSKAKMMCIISEDDDISVWMFAMIGIGCVFVVFVAVSIYLMW